MGYTDIRERSEVWVMLAGSLLLIGMPGSGKTTIGKYVADKVNAGFTDTDDLIRAKSGKSLQEIIEEDGLDAFMRLESDILLNYVPDKPQVIATGGSAVLYDDAMMHLKSLGKVIFLDADLPLLRKRLWNEGSRGLAYEEPSGSGSDVSDAGNSRLLNIYIRREPLYYRYSDIRVHVRGRSVEDIAGEIISQI